jgi:hypothetical protein
MPLTTLRGWCDQYGYEPKGTRDKGGHRRFSDRDVLILAIAWRAVAHGMRIGESLSMADDAMRRVDKETVHDAVEDLSGWRLVAWTTEYKAGVTFTSYELKTGPVASGPHVSRRGPFPAPESWVVIDLGEVARAVARRLGILAGA